MKRSHTFHAPFFAVLIVGVLASASTTQAQAPAHDDTVFRNGFGEAPNVIRARQGLAIAPVELDLYGRNAELVGIGSYIVNSIGGCNDCHTNPPYAAGGDPYMGQPKQINVNHYLAGGGVFGPFISRNLTPSGPDSLPAGLTYQQFRDAITNGTDFRCAVGDPPPCPLLQVMPWPVLRHMSEHDKQAIYEYLSAIPHAEPGS